MASSIEHKITNDGSSTLYASQYEQHYHSIHGAVNESMHVFIEAGLQEIQRKKNTIHILEMGFGTGLNALLAYVHKENSEIQYTTIEAQPVSLDTAQTLNYPTQIQHLKTKDFFIHLHETPWNKWVQLSPSFHIYKYHGLLEDFESSDRFDVVFFDAFAPNAQPELWTPEIFQKIFDHCNDGAILTTYSAKGDVRRALQTAGFKVTKLPGPPGKREMLRGEK